MLREFVVNWLGTEDGADDVLRRAWARFEKMRLSRGADYRAVLLRLAEKAGQELRRKALESADAGRLLGAASESNRPASTS